MITSHLWVEGEKVEDRENLDASNMDVQIPSWFLLLDEWKQPLKELIIENDPFDHMKSPQIPIKLYFHIFS